MRRVFCLLLVLVMMASLCVQAFADEILYCRMCGKKIPADSKVCSYCGEKVVHVDQDAVSSPAPAENKTGSSLLADIAASIPPLPAPSAAPEAQAAPVQAAAPAPAAAAPAPAPAQATDVKTALMQSSAPSPITQTAQTAVPGPFNTTLGSTGSSGNRVRVTKSPTSESVPYGGSCTFIAHAANATSVTWYIANSDASIICAASDAPYSVSGLYVSGANSDTLYLSGIPSWWNGCQVQACFTGEGGPVYTEAARIWTYQPAQGVDTSCWSWWDWFCYYYRDDPYYWDYPWDWYNYWVSYPHYAPFWFHPNPYDHDFDLNPRPDPTKVDPHYDRTWTITNPDDPDTRESIIVLEGKYPDGRGNNVIKIDTGNDIDVDKDYLDFIWENQFGLTRQGLRDIAERQAKMKEERERSEGTQNGNNSQSQQNAARESVVISSYADTETEMTVTEAFGHHEDRQEGSRQEGGLLDGVVVSGWADTDSDATLEGLLDSMS